MTRFGFCLISLAVFLYAHSASADLIAYYPLDDDVEDHSGNEFHGEVIGNVFSIGPGSGYDGVGGSHIFGLELPPDPVEPGRINIPIDIGPDEYPELSVTMWVKADPSIFTEEAALTRGHHPKVFGHDDDGWDRSFGLDNRQDCCEPKGPLRWAAFTGGAGPGPTQEIPGAEITDEWTFLAAVWNAGTNEVRLHVNDLFEASAYTPGNSLLTNATIGGLRPDNFNEFWVGQIDEVRIYDTALSALEVGQIRDPAVEAPSCDFNEDGACDLVDIDSLTSQGDLKIGVAAADPRFDLNGDTVLDTGDIDVWLSQVGEARGFTAAVLAGDADLNGTVEAADLNAVGLSWQQGGKVWSEGDFDGSGTVDASDLNVVGLNWQKSVAAAAAASVPEPTSLVILSTLGFFLAGLRRQISPGRSRF